MGIDKKVHKDMMRARLDLMIKEPFFGTLAMQLEMIECEAGFCDTMAVDGRHLWYHPPFVTSLTQQELTGVVAHEVMHCCYKHMTRRGHRHPVRWNWAGDYVINSDLLKGGFTLPKKRLHDPKYDGMSTEEVYEHMPEPPTIHVIGASGAGKNGGSSGKGKGNSKPNDGDGEGGKGSGQGLPDGADKGGCGGVIDAAPAHDKAKQDQADTEWEGMVRMAVNIAKRARAGTLPAYLDRLVKFLAKPKINWRDVLRQFVDGHMTKDFSWAHPNRRFVHTGLHLPGHVNDSLHHLAFFADTSGSITKGIMEAYLGEVQGTLDDGVADQVTRLVFDAAVHEIDEYTPGDLIDVATDKMSGGGGTDFLPMMEWAAKQPDISCIVVLTDMMPCHWNIPDPGVPVLWGAYCGEDFLATVKPPYGDVLHIDNAHY